MTVDIRRATAPLRSFPRRSVSVCSQFFEKSSPSTMIIRMRCPMMLSIFLALIAASLVSGQHIKCNDGNFNCYDNSLTSPSPSSAAAVPNHESNSEDDCECVKYYLCQNGIISTIGDGLIEPKIGGTSSDTPTYVRSRKCSNDIDICCKRPYVLERKGTTGEGTTEDYKDVSPNPPLHKSCGQQRIQIVGKITEHDDNEAQVGEFPWMVAIFKVAGIKNLKLYQCGGSLIHTRAVLTAAHTVKGTKQSSHLKIHAGVLDTQSGDEIFPHQERDVEHIITHDKFHSGALHNDIAILILKTPVELAENVGLVCLPPPSEVFDGARCSASGWGKNKAGKDGHYQPILKKVELPIVSHDVCQSKFRTTRLGNYYNLDATFICAGGEPGKDTCKGDGGSPLVCPLENYPLRYVQAGIVSWGIGCGEKLIPGAYTNVALLRHWIDEQMVNHNLDTSVYQV